MSFKRLVVALLAPAVVALIAYAALVAINLSDEPLNKDAKSFIASAQLESPHEENGFFAALGWRASEGADAHKAGREAFEKYRQTPRGQRRSVELPKQLPLPGAEELCQRQATDCLRTVGADIAKFRNAMKKHDVLLRRLDSIARYSRVHRPIVALNSDDLILLPPVSDLMRLGRTHSAVLWLSGAHGQALDGVASRSATARRALRDASTMLDMLLASFWLQSEVALLAEMMFWDPKIVARHAARVSQILQPLDQDDLRSVGWVRGEYAVMSVPVLATPRSGPDRLSVIGDTLWPNVFHETVVEGKPLPVLISVALPLLDPLMQPAATANLLYERFTRAEIPLAMASTLRIATERRTAATAPQSCSFAVRNPVGRCYVGAADRPQFGEYIADRHELDRFLRLAAVQLELIRRNTRPEDVRAVLASFAGAVDPATQKPVNWDLRGSRLWIKAMSERWKRRIGAVPGHISLVYTR